MSFRARTCIILGKASPALVHYPHVAQYLDELLYILGRWQRAGAATTLTLHAHVVLQYSPA